MCGWVFTPYLVERCHDAITSEHFTKVLSVAFNVLGLAVGKRVVLIRKLENERNGEKRNA